ncbi:hypothetical protein C1A50_4801 [Paenibacillus polymyxa]|nr:hypothetical protein C1A50_4801 [Paenibacillus polymyxa]
MTSKDRCWSSHGNAATDLTVATYYQGANVSCCITRNANCYVAFFSTSFVIYVETYRQLERCLLTTYFIQRQSQSVAISRVFYVSWFDVSSKQNSSFGFRSRIPFKTARQFQLNVVFTQRTSCFFFNFQSCSEVFFTGNSVSSGQRDLTRRNNVTNYCFTTSQAACRCCINSNFDRAICRSSNINFTKVQVKSSVICRVAEIQLYSCRIVSQFSNFYCISIVISSGISVFSKVVITCIQIHTQTISSVSSTVYATNTVSSAGEFKAFWQCYCERCTSSDGSLSNNHSCSTQSSVVLCTGANARIAQVCVARSCMDSSWCSQCCDWSCNTSNQCCCCQHVDHFFVKLCHNLFFSSLNINRNIIFVFLSDLVTHQSLHLLSELYENPYKMISVTISQKLGI